MAIDDEQWLDRPSARVLAFALCRLREEPVCVLLTRRVDSDGALWPELARNFGPDGLKALTVAPLDLGALDALLRAKLGRTILRPVLRHVHAASGGNPLYALAIARELDASGSRPDDIPIPRTLSAAIQQRLHYLLLMMLWARYYLAGLMVSRLIGNGIVLTARLGLLSVGSKIILCPEL